MALNQEVQRSNEENMKYVQTVPVAYYENHSADEINLLDLWLALVKRKNLFFAVLVFCALLGVSYALIKPRAFDFYAALDIGRRMQLEVFLPIQEPDSVREKILQGYVPLIGVEFLKANPDTYDVPVINVS